MLLSVLFSLLVVNAIGLTTTDLPTQVLSNGGFEDGLQGWEQKGTVTLDKATPLDGSASARLGPGEASIHQKYEVGGLQILNYSATLKFSSPSESAQIRLRCYDRKGRVLMNQTGSVDPRKGVEAKGAAADIYLKTHAFTSYVIISIENLNSSGSVLVDDVKLEDTDRNRTPKAPLVDLDAYMRPLWTGQTVLNESVLLLSANGQIPTGKLLFHPDEILSVKNAQLDRTFIEGKDFKVDDRSLIALPNSSIPTMSDQEFPKEKYPWANLAGRHIFVTYRHHDELPFSLPKFEGQELHHSLKALSSKKNFIVVAYGDSITLGINVSGFRDVPPYMPPWPTLAVRELSRIYGNEKIMLYNTALGGMTSEWAKDNAEEAVASLKPDLVLLAFGMNDFWSLNPQQFLENIKATTDTIKKSRPNVEFILISSIKFDPAYTTEETYVNNLAGYSGVLKTLAGPGVALLDMTELSDHLYRVKSAKDLQTDPMHPDDFFARWYAQGVVALLSPHS